jgi:hypothetical protein
MAAKDENSWGNSSEYVDVNQKFSFLLYLVFIYSAVALGVIILPGVVWFFNWFFCA